MTLPSALKRAIYSITETKRFHPLIEAREELSQRYRAPDGSQKITTDVQ